MDIDLSLPSGDHDKDEDRNTIADMLEDEEKMHSGDLEGHNMVGASVDVHALDNGNLNSSTVDMAIFKEDTNLEPLSGMEFESHGEAYSFYQEYARSMGFNTAIQNSRRSKTSREFIDAKFACSRYGTKREHDKSFNRPRARQGKQDAENSTGRRSCSKTDCKASMHVKRRADGKWVIHSFVKEHNHDLLPAQAVSEQTRKMYAAMARQFAEYKTVVGLKNEKSPFDKGRNLGLESGDAKLLLDFLVQMHGMNSNFFYAVDIGEDQRLKNLLWIDAKSRHDYMNFCDVVSFDTFYVRNKYKLPLVLFVGVNQHYQFLLLGCALISDESAATYSWLMRTWLKGVGGQAPRVVIIDHDKTLKSAILDAFPNAHHSMCLWHVLGKVSENLAHVIKRHENFMAKFEKCIYRSWTNDEFEKRWWKIVDRFELREDACLQSLYEDRKLWAPTFIRDIFLCGLSTAQRSESVNSFFDKYVHKKTSVQDFVKQYEAILQDRYEEEAKGDSETWNKVATLKTPSPLEKSVAGSYTHAMFKKIQVEVIGAVACHPKAERQDDAGITYKVHDMEKNQDFSVVWNEIKSEVSCICRLFEYKGFLCRHALIVLQYSGLSVIPSQYILKRWTRDAKGGQTIGGESEHVLARVQRYNDLCQQAMKLSEEGSLSQDSYSVAFHLLREAYRSCVSVNNSCRGPTPTEAVISAGHSQLSAEEDTQSRSMSKTNKKKNPTKKKKLNCESEVMTVGAQDNMQQMDKFNARTVTLDGYYGSQQNVQGMLNLMGPTRENYYGNQQTIQGLGQLSSIPTSHDGYYGAHQSMPGLAQLDFFRAPTNFPYGIRDDPNVRPTQLHEDPSRHA